MEDLEVKKRGRDESEESELEAGSPEVKRLQETLLGGLDDDASDFCTTSQDLDSYVKSFEEEITASPSSGEAVQVVDLASDSCESRPDLGYLLEASDDELGLPPTASVLKSDTRTELVRVESDSSELGSEFLEVPGYDPFGCGFGESETNCNGGNSEYVELEGLFDYSDIGFESDDFAWRPETLPAQ